MRHPLHALGLFAVLATGCDRLQDDPIFAYGRAEHPDGAPMAGVTLHYDRARIVEPPTNGGPPVPWAPPQFTPYGTATTEATGDFFLEMRYGDVHAPDPNAPIPGVTQDYRFRVSLLREDGAGVFASFTFRDDVELPTLRPWDSRLRLEPGLAGHVVSFEPAPPVPQVPVTGEELTITTPEGEEVPQKPTTPEVVLQVFSGDQMAFRWWGATSPWTASPYVLEDFASPELRLRAMSLGVWYFYPLGAKHSNLVFRQEWRTPPLSLPAGDLRPVSRGVACSPTPKEGTCPWTDGRLEQVAVSWSARESRWLTLTLPEARVLRHAVVRGMSGGLGGGFRLEGSLDGEQWSVLASSRFLLSDSNLGNQVGGDLGFEEATRWDSPFDGSLYKRDEAHFGEAALTDVGPVRYVRITGVDFANNNNGAFRGFARLAEVSLFE
ncbi:hypothetical protein HPC49_12815 [Pyxidicoccus fallax]|uniref:Uncharacterized protein n=1 Tax=Pyxidicoccus fallax TaxID=394095 RepID=A0A848LB12_9BACT|nr:hypothetical protein [Pyxidicoccus fallax]NMO15422.1 hypothetical protein [Pyxidicoccus fallax]NPC79117.1 hypothetical protein [Pyxidicoccus fallax]